MDDKKSGQECEAEVYSREVERQNEELEAEMRAIRQQEDERDLELLDASRMLDQMARACDYGDETILQLIEEKQQMLYEVRNKRADFLTELEYRIKQKKQQDEDEKE